MLRFKLLSAATFAGLALAATGAHAADMPEYIEPQPIAVAAGGWYLRGDIGASHQFVDEFSSPYWDEVSGPTSFVDLQHADFEASFFIGVGFGYQFNDWFRADVTGEYRFKSDFNGLDYYDENTATPDADGTNIYTGDKTEWVILANGYVDLPAWGIMKPFVGAGIGAARIEISDFTDFNPVVPGTATGFSGDTATWNLAWALHAGLAFEIDRNWTFEVAYRFLHMGDVETDDLVAANGDNDTFNPFNFDGIASHDLKVGMRYIFD